MPQSSQPAYVAEINKIQTDFETKYNQLANKYDALQASGLSTQTQQVQEATTAAQETQVEAIKYKTYLLAVVAIIAIWIFTRK